MHRNLPRLTRTLRIAAGFLITCAVAGVAAAQGPKIYISVDMEGIAGVVTGDQLGPQGFEYQRFREFMTAETLAAIEGGRAAGATEFVVSDSHGNGENLLIEKFSKDVQIVRAWPRPLAMMEGIDATFGAAVFIGYHTSTVNPAGVRAHTMSSANLADIRVNGVSVSEAGLNAAIAGHFGVPVVMITGDDVIVKEARGMLPGIEGAVVKTALGFHSAKTMTPEAACDLIRETARKAVARAKEVKPHKIKEPVDLEIRFKNYRPSELLAYLSIVERIDSHAIRFRAKDILEATRFIEFVLNYQPDLAP